MYSAMSLHRNPQVLPFMGLMGLGQDPVSGGVQLAAVALASWLQNKRTNALNKVYTTSVVNDLEPLLNANKNAYLAGPGTCVDQAAALSAFDSAMQWLQSPQACGNPALGSAGQNCINDRLPGGQWDWTAMYRTPIASDSRPVCNSAADAAEQSAVANVLNKISGNPVQTNSDMFQASSSPTTAPASGVTVTATGVTMPGYAGVDLMNLGTVAGMPVTYLLLGAGALVLVLMLS